MIVPEYLSAEWFDAANEAIAELSTPEQVTIRFEVADTCTYDLTVGPNSSFEADASGTADVVLSLDYATAAAISQGIESAQAAFMSGRMRLGGDAMALVTANAELETATDRLLALRDATTYRDA